MHHATILVAILTFVPLASATAQEPPPVKVGDRVRVTASGIRKQAGRLEALSADTLVVAVADSTVTFPVASVTRLEVSHGIDFSGVGVGAIIGGSALGSLGLLAGLGAAHECGPGFIELFCEYSAEDVLLVTAVMVVVGAAVGSVFGLLASIGDGESWERVGPPALRNLSVAPQRDGRLGLGLSVRF